MPLEKSDAACIADMLDAGRAILGFMEDLAYETFVRDRMRCRAVEREFEIVGEAARKLSAAFRHEYSDLPLAKVIGLRNVIAHGYAEVDYRVLFRIAQEDLPVLVKKLEQLPPAGRKRH